MARCKKLVERHQQLFEMANITRSKFGVPVNFWASPKPDNKKPYLRIKIATHEGLRANPSEEGAYLMFDLATGKLYKMKYKTTEKTIPFGFEEVSIKSVKIVINLIERYFYLFKEFWELQKDEDEFKDALLDKIKSKNP